MLNVSAIYKPFMLGVIMLNASPIYKPFMLGVIMLNVIRLGVLCWMSLPYIYNPFMLVVIMLNIIRLGVICWISVSYISPLWWVSLCWMSTGLVSLGWMPLPYISLLCYVSLWWMSLGLVSYAEFQFRVQALYDECHYAVCHYGWVLWCPKKISCCYQKNASECSTLIPSQKQTIQLDQCLQISLLCHPSKPIVFSTTLVWITRLKSFLSNPSFVTHFHRKK